MARGSLYVTTSLGTRLCIATEDDTVTAGSLKLSLAEEHCRAFPQHGPVVVTAFQTSFQGADFTLADSLRLSLLRPHNPPLLLNALLLPLAAPPPHSHHPNANKKRRSRPQHLSSHPPHPSRGVALLTNSKPQGQDSIQVLRKQGDFNMLEDSGTGDTWRSSHQKRSKKMKNGKEGTSMILSCHECKTNCNNHVSTIRVATKEGDNAEKGAELEGSCGSSNAPVCKELVPQDMVPPDRKKLLVLDINGLLADISYADYKDQHYAHFKISGKSVFRRPFCIDFLKFCFSNFEVGVWSSRVQHNLEKAVDHLFGAMRGNLLFCWDQSKCTPTVFKTLENRPLFLKDLSKLWDKVEPGLPWEKGRFSPTNTLLVDDTPCKASLNPSWTAIFPFPYNKNLKDNALGPGGEIRVYLEKIAAAEDVPKYVEGHPFGLAAWRKHPRWKHYVTMRDALIGS